MKREPLELLSTSNIQNDIVLPIWIYRIEPVVVKARRFLKVYLLDRLDAGSEINRITFLHAGKEYEVKQFSQISKYSDSSYNGCVIALDLEDTSTDLTIQQEIVSGKIYNASDHLINFNLAPKEVEADKENYLRSSKKIVFYPFIREDHWLCACGRIHSNEDSICSCGRDLSAIKELLTFDFDSAFINDYLKNSIPFNYDKSFEDNLADYTDAFSRIHPETSVEKLLSSMDLKAEESRYEEGLRIIAEEKRIAAEKAAKKLARKKRIVLGFLAVLLITGGCFAAKDTILPAIERHQDNQRLRKANVGDTFIFGSYEQDDNTENGPEDIKWIVLAKEEGRVLLISEKILDRKVFSKSNKKWNESDLRAYLNNTFFNTSFNSTEKKCIKTENDDKVFVLSTNEAELYLSGNEYGKSSFSNYAKPDYGYDPNYWLRSPSELNKRVTSVNADGTINYWGYYNTDYCGVRPAIWFDISK